MAGACVEQQVAQGAASMAVTSGAAEGRPSSCLHQNNFGERVPHRMLASGSPSRAGHPLARSGAEGNAARIAPAPTHGLAKQAHPRHHPVALDQPVPQRAADMQDDEESTKKWGV